MIKFFCGACFGAALLFSYQHVTTKDIKTAQSKAISTWKAVDKEIKK